MKKYYLLSIFILLAVSYLNAQVTGMTPAVGVHGQTLQTTITGNGIFIQTSSPGGNIYSIQLVKPPDIIDVYYYWNWWSNIQVVDPNTVTTDFYIPPSVQAGVYDLQIVTGDPWNPMYNQTLYTLPGAFTVSPPAGTISGTVYHDLNENGIKDTGEPGISGYSVTISPSNYSVYTNSSGTYSFPVPNGTYSITCNVNSNNYLFPSTINPLSVTINNNNAPGTDFGFKSALISVTPDFGYRGMSRTHQIVSDVPIFTTGGNPNGNIYYISILSSPYTVTAYSSNITVIDSFTARFVLTIPSYINAGNNLDIRVSLSSGYYGIHYLKQQFDIVIPPVFVSGTIFFDQNQNKLYDTGEPGLNHVKTFLTPDSSIAFSDFNGNYSLGSLGGQQTLAHAMNNPELTLFTDSATFTFNATGTITGKNFGFIASAPDYSIQLKDISLFARCNSLQYVYFTVRNNSNIAYNATVWIKRDPMMTFISSPTPPTLISNDTIYWDIPNILPFSSVSRRAIFQMPGIGNTLNFTVGTHSLNASNVIQMTTCTTKTYNVFCAYDPNDKQVTPEGVFAQHFTLMSDTLDYLIRFQNTGNDTAFNIVILDTLDSNLDFQTFEILESSHSMKTELEKTGMITFNFNNILLPDSNVNEPGSHGYIRYRIRPRQNLPDSTLVDNTAYIYFDFNPAIVTNSPYNTLVYTIPQIGPLPVELVEFSAKPDKEQIAVRWKTASELNNDYFTLEKGSDGITYEEIATVPGAGTSSNMHSYIFYDKYPFEGIQYYRLSQTDYDGTKTYFDPVMVRWNSDADFHIYPNPSDGQLYADVSLEYSKQAGKLIINDAYGRLILSKEINFESTTYAVPLFEPSEHLSAGSYFVSMNFAGKTFTQLVIVK